MIIIFSDYGAYLRKYYFIECIKNGMVYFCVLFNQHRRDMLFEILLIFRFYSIGT